jgi:hypothetical protein
MIQNCNGSYSLQSGPNAQGNSTATQKEAEPQYTVQMAGQIQDFATYKYRPSDSTAKRMTK